jgi:hypothetical protein
MNQQILIAIIAASAALFGVIISQGISTLLSFLDKKHKKYILLRQKYEEMMFHFQDSLLYFNELATCKNRDQLLQNTASIPANRAMGLALLYFPALAPLLGTYIRYYVEYYELLVTTYDPNIPANAGAQARVHAKEELQNIESRLFKAKKELLNAINENAKKYTKA